MRLLVFALLAMLPTGLVLGQTTMPETSKLEIRAVLEQYQATLASHADIICEYEYTFAEARSLEDALARKWIPGSNQFASRGVYMSKAGKVLAKEYALHEPVEVSGNVRRGGANEFLTNAEWRTIHIPEFNVLSLGSKGHLKNDRWGPSFTPWSLGVMGNTRHLPGTENSGVYNRIMERLDSPDVTARQVTIDVANRGVPELALQIDLTPRTGPSRRRYFFTTPDEYGVPLLSRFERYTQGQEAPKTIALVVEYERSPYGLPFPVKCLRVSESGPEANLLDAVWIEVTKLEKSDHLKEEAFHLDIQEGARVSLEDSGRSIHLARPISLDFASMPQLEQQVFDSIEENAHRQESDKKHVTSHRANYFWLLMANAVAITLVLAFFWRNRRVAK